MNYFQDTPKSRTEILNLLREGKVTLHITKSDESQRALVATLSIDIVPPPAQRNTEAKERVLSPNSQVVWDTDINEWRSFRWDRLHTFSKYVTPETIGLS